MLGEREKSRQESCREFHQESSREFHQESSRDSRWDFWLLGIELVKISKFKHLFYKIICYGKISYNFSNSLFYWLKMNFSNYQNRRKIKKCWTIDLYAILKPSAKFKLNWFTSVEIIQLLIFGCWTCILMGKHNMKKCY